jgi:hypothetical protein
MVGDAIRTCLWREHASVSELSRDFRILKGFMKVGIETMTVIREWHGTFLLTPSRTDTQSRMSS